MINNSTAKQEIYLSKQNKDNLKRPLEKVEISKEEIINTLKTIESLKRKWLSYLK